MASATFGWILIIGSILFGSLAIVVLLTWMKSHRLRIRDPMNTKSYIVDYWVTEQKNKNSGVLFWKSVFWQPKIKTPVPPAKALEVGKRGRKFAEAYRVSEDEFIWITDGGLKTQIEIDKEGRRKAIIVDIDKDGKQHVIDSFKPFSPVQRETIVNQYEKAQLMRNRKWSADKIVSMSAMGAFVIIIVCIFIFWGDIAAPVIEIQNQNNQVCSQAIQKLSECNSYGNSGSTPNPQNPNVIVQEGVTTPPKK